MARTEEDFLAAQRLSRGRCTSSMPIAPRPCTPRWVRRSRPRRVCREHRGRVALARRPCRVHRQGRRRRARVVLPPDLHAAGVHFATAPLVGGAPTRVVHPDHTRRRADDEHLPRGLRCAVAGRRRRAGRGRLGDHLPGEATCGIRPRAAKRSGRSRRGPPRRPGLAYPLRRLRRSFSRRVPQPHPHANGRHRLANASELRSLYPDGKLDAAIAALRRDDALAAVTVGAQGALVVTRDEVTQLPQPRSTRWWISVRAT